MKKIVFIVLLLWSSLAIAQGQFNTPTFTYGGQTYNVRNNGTGIIIKNTNTVIYNSTGVINLRAPEPERYCSDTEFPVKYKDIGDKLVNLNATLFSKRRRVELDLNRDIIYLTLIASKETLQIIEVVFRLKSGTILTREEIYKMEQAYKTLHVALHPYNPNNCTFNYLVVNIEINPNWEVK